ncbi:9962_t:CDS:2 [Paraglomus occultum]|uniref:9962_t:CDS:1 n=1 Tax=Paraglomus occultum TaxID=144539 RepID=A0A9N9A0H5_9GLOM|nr:9962_t:CDS:2 [Paraglomus occultum]
MQALTKFLVCLGLVTVLALVIYGYAEWLKKLRIDSSVEEYTIIQGVQEALSASIQTFRARVATFEKHISNYQAHKAATSQYVVSKEDVERRELVQQLEEKKALILVQLRKDGAIEKVNSLSENKVQ